jgi:hypothetical protein
MQLVNVIQRCNHVLAITQKHVTVAWTSTLGSFLNLLEARLGLSSMRQGYRPRSLGWYSTIEIIRMTGGFPTGSLRPAFVLERPRPSTSRSDH